MSALWNEIAPWRDRLVKKAAMRRRTPNLACDRNGDTAPWLQRKMIEGVEIFAGFRFPAKSLRNGRRHEFFRATDCGFQ